MASARCANGQLSIELGTPPPPWTPLSLEAAGTVQALHVPKGRMAVLECQQGLLWLTQQDLWSDRFAEAGQRLYCPGPARLYLGAQGNAPALVRWVLLPRGSHAPA
ncbi:DUF2917 domain-containing protein [Comamonas sp. UBA7528]|jgi:hypothetical protein|uniref:DUF2917 domain-containing protein n=1 Tax=Comamonas sp. UBA7528 TaxID=1946391 RepID=UPI001B718CD9|nr:DUF2917 domain-containing protein [Comamonas sp. UBA7528]MBP7352754.1 DUF2917 domain-containing protein [Comamonas sp.]